LDIEARKQIWSNLMTAAGMDAKKMLETVDRNGKDAEGGLEKFDLNGRQIRTTIRLAQALACDEGSAVKEEHIKRTLRVAEQFQEDLKKIRTGELDN